MCAICLEWQKQKITSKEAFGAINEMLASSKDKGQVKHLEELSEKIISTEVPETQADEELDKTWSDETYRK